MPVPFTPKEPMQVRFEMIEPEAPWPMIDKPNVSFTLFHKDGSTELCHARVRDVLASQFKVGITYDCLASIAAMNGLVSSYLAITSLKIGDITVPV